MTGGMCPRKVMNVDPQRERCRLPELSDAKLRRVAFCVDVEVAGGPRYNDEVDAAEKRKKLNEKKLKERGEGEALKHPNTAVEEKESAMLSNTEEEDSHKKSFNAPESADYPETKKDISRKKEKKKRSEAERKERKEKKRREAEERGQIPRELNADDDESVATVTPSGASTPNPQGQPTTDPLRIYRRCCQLRETPILKRISDQICSDSPSLSSSPGIVSSLDLSGSRLQLADFVTLGDWLAVVPVLKLTLDDSGLTDEALRIVLAGLLAARVPGGVRRRHHETNGSSKPHHRLQKLEKCGFVERLSLKNNSKITEIGWRHISLFVYMCKPLKALDLSSIQFPQNATKLDNSIELEDGQYQGEILEAHDMAEVFSKALSERLASGLLEELILAECGLTPRSIQRIVDAATISGVQRLGLASNSLDKECYQHISTYLRSGVCRGLDLGGNDLREYTDILSEGLTEESPLWALSLAACNLTPTSLSLLLPKLSVLPDLRFIDLSHNQELFSINPSAVKILRKYLPKFKMLKRIHLMDVSISPAQAITLAEILPECRHLAHVNLLENSSLSTLARASDEASSEEACALYASLLAAVRVSNSIMCVDIDVPAPETSDIVKALAKQVIAYCLRNMERATRLESSDSSLSKPAQGGENELENEIEVPEVLLHLTGDEGQMDDEPAPDDDYIVGGTGVVKALSYCLLEKASDLRRSLPASGTSTPKMGRDGVENGECRALEMSNHLLGSARKIRTRLQPALEREATGNDEMAYRKSLPYSQSGPIYLNGPTGRLLYLEKTLQGIIKRFEDEYPETRISDSSVAENQNPEPPASGRNSSMAGRPGQGGRLNQQAEVPQNYSDSDSNSAKGSPINSRRASDISLASRALALEEGHVHRFGQQVRRDILQNPAPSHPVLNPDANDDEIIEPPYITALREKLATLSGDEIREFVVHQGWEKTVKMLSDNAEELSRLEKEHPEEFRTFREAQLAALQN